MGEETPADRERREAENARLAHEQTVLLWEDEVAFAETLRDKRRTYSTGLVILVGLGVFRLAWTKDPSHVPALDSWAVRQVLKGIVGLALLCFLASAYFMYSERPTVSAAIAARWGWMGKVMGGIKKALGFRDEIARPEMGAALKGLGGRGPARLALTLRQERLEQIREAPTSAVWRYRQWKLALACQRLAMANSRVNHRIEFGVLAMLAGYVLLAAAFMVYNLFV
jgi:hypothetical protein